MSARQAKLRFETPSTARVNSFCTLCGGTGWRYVGDHAVTRCICRQQRRAAVVPIRDYKAAAAGER
jgi:hypothetical protein